MIIEQKEITVQAAPKIEAMEAEMNRLGGVYGFDPAASSALEISEAITSPRDKLINNPVYLKQMRFLEEDMSRANRQILHTKQRLYIPTDGGLVVILNDVTAELSTRVTMVLLSRLIKMVGPDGSRRFQNIDALLMFHERPFSGPHKCILCIESAHTNRLVDMLALRFMQVWVNGIHFTQLDY